MDMAVPPPILRTTNLEYSTKYVLGRCLGAGGMGSVYEATQIGAEGFTKQVAIKLINKAIAAKPEFLKNFVGEAKLVAQLVHTNIVQTYQLGMSDDGPFIVMELVQGTDLLNLMGAHGARGIHIPTELCVFIASRICRGLSYAHAKLGHENEPLGIVHRDISPQNILVAREGDVKITDFGLAKAQNYMFDGEGEYVVGKMCYMSPEQAQGFTTDDRSDIYSIGVVLSELLTGHNIFTAESSGEMLQRILELQIPNFDEMCPYIPKELSKILHKALARNPEERYPNAGVMLVDLETFIYSKGYGPTSETLAAYMRDFIDAKPASKNRGDTTVLLA
jgi:serine/threonine-protein kinase